MMMMMMMMMMPSRAGHRFKNTRELFDGYKHKIQMEYVETGVLLEADQEGDERPELNVVCQLVVNNVMSDDCGEVECRAFNSGGMDSTRAQLFMRCTSLTVLLITSVRVDTKVQGSSGQGVG